MFRLNATIGSLNRHIFKNFNIRQNSKLSINNNKRFQDKVAVVTASTEGIGLAIAKRFAQEGAHVVISSRRKENVTNALNTLKQEGLTNVSGIVCHVGDKKDREALLQHTLKQGGVDILVNNAGLNLQYGPIQETTEEIWDKMLDINLKSAFLTTQEFLPHMKKRGGGSILFMSSILALHPHPMMGVYSLSKLTLHALTKVLAHNIGPRNIRVNCIAPGGVHTKMGKQIENDHFIKTYSDIFQPVSRFAVPEEIAGVVAFICSDDASFINGEIIGATGGARAWLM
ncbi:Dehydrogenase reductase SDR member 4 [Chamberlinius hualienensis]